jgi:hypothetical protein
MPFQVIDPSLYVAKFDDARENDEGTTTNASS